MKRRRFKTSLARRKQVRAASRKWQRSPRGAYSQQKLNAKKRGIAWEFTFESWWAWWQASDHWKDRSRRGWCMARKGDAGPYSTQNCVCVPMSVNAHVVLVHRGMASANTVPEEFADAF